MSVSGNILNALQNFIKCPIHALTGIPCAACGMTRAWVSLLQGNVAQAFYFHPLFWMVPVIILLVIFRKKLPRKIQRLAIFVFPVLFFTIYFVRLADPADTVLTFEPQSGLIYQALAAIF